MSKRWLRYVAVALLAPLPSRALAACQIRQFLELPVTMSGPRPIVSASIGGKDARLILDSGAFFSTLSRASAQEYGLQLAAAPSWFRLRGINGDASASFATVKDFGLAGATLPRVDFIVGGSDTGTVGLLGQNILGIADVEYDLPHGHVRLMKADDCAVDSLAYWATGRPYSIVPLVPRQPPFQTHTIGTVTINGVKLKAVFDTGAGSSILTLAAAKRAGVTPESPGVEPAGIATGLGSKSARSWIATFATIEIGGEALKHPKIRFGDVTLGQADMLIGADFFLSHRIYVANKASKMLITYEGGPLFGLNPRGAVDPEGKKLDLTDKTPEPTDAEGYSRRAAILSSQGRFEPAIADLDRAIALAPAVGRYFGQRAIARLANGQLLLAAADFDRALQADPGDADARIARAGMRLGGRDPKGAAEDLAIVDKALPPTSDKRLVLGQMLDAAGQLDASVGNFDAWLKSHPQDAKRAVALNGRCWVRAQLNRDLDGALDDCNAALKQRPGTASYLDSRALVRFRRGELAAALADYDAALKDYVPPKIAPRSAWTLYARSLVKRRLGDTAGAEADRAAALAAAPGVEERARRMGLSG
ncbi:aspartyl protease family protein [Sphingomonas sp. BIUV-7]|uniref:Aspartyl protease family protein n=1 Tax=Sphingomonas natans TaxID=3063330 RepID=A0ABT8Y9R6_9SPHN|nr:aspartyl protease family protein [Sphingomonas sp. BIUV-7]MDO6415072.1 aspartyl protease family protein [Sphingomonas sp. BIUV-7]